MKLNKIFAISLLVALTMGGMSSCSDDDNLGEAPRLFRPVASLETSNNTIKATWDNISGATAYQLTLYRVATTNEAGENTYEEVTTVTCEGSPYTFTDLAWDEKYHVAISCNNDKKSSGIYTTDDVNVNYISSLTSTKLIDNAARISWKTDGDVIKAIKAVPADGGEAVTVVVKRAEFENGYKDVYGLNPETSYTFYTYKDSETFNNDTYAGKLTGVTKASVDFDEKYGAGMWIDIRDWDLTSHADTLQKPEFWANIQNGMTIILRGEQQYKVNNSVVFDRSVSFITGPTLGNNAQFVSSGGLTCAKGVTIEKLKFEDIDFISDKALNDESYAIAACTDKGFGGRQVFNINGTDATVNELIFKDCTMTGYRAVVRSQKDNDAILNLSFKGCVINGIGDQGVVTTTNKAGDWRNVSFEDCTITNIVMLCDFRLSANPMTMSIKNCTFCYAPIETTANANTPLFRLGDNTVTLDISNTIFGPSMQTEGSAGDNIVTFNAGTTGSIFLNANNALVSVSKSFKTNFAWSLINEKTYPIDGLTELSLDEVKLWQSPATGDFKIIGNIGESGIGDSRWIQ